ncbi:hypothetical protein [Streptomyces sp. NPDC051109]|uniref:hypothetical protein n=1 Tax=Streptomyces sp. NPDC051109 TaxID=3365642 RepID=UPI0037AD9B00
MDVDHGRPVLVLGSTEWSRWADSGETASTTASTSSGAYRVRSGSWGRSVSAAYTGLIDGALVFMMSPRRSWHGRLVTALTTTLMAQAPVGFEVEREVAIRLDVPTAPSRTSCFREPVQVLRGPAVGARRAHSVGQCAHGSR